MSNRDEYVKKMKAKLDEWNAEIDRLSAKAEQSEADARMRNREEVEKLKRQREDCRVRLEELRNSSGDAWDAVRRGMDDSWERMNVAFKEAKARFH